MAKYFEKKNIPICEYFKHVQKQIFKGTELIKKKYVVVFKIWAKKKSGNYHLTKGSIPKTICNGGPSHVSEMNLFDVHSSPAAFWTCGFSYHLSSKLIDLNRLLS